MSGCLRALTLTIRFIIFRHLPYQPHATRMVQEPGFDCRDTALRGGGVTEIEPRSRVQRLESAFVRPASSEGLFMVAKHFPGCGLIDENPHDRLSVVGMGGDDWRREWLSPLHAAIDAGVAEHHDRARGPSCAPSHWFGYEHVLALSRTH